MDSGSPTIETDATRGDVTKLPIANATSAVNYTYTFASAQDFSTDINSDFRMDVYFPYGAYSTLLKVYLWVYNGTKNAYHSTSGINAYGNDWLQVGGHWSKFTYAGGFTDADWANITKVVIQVRHTTGIQDDYVYVSRIRKGQKQRALFAFVFDDLHANDYWQAFDVMQNYDLPVSFAYISTRVDTQLPLIHIQEMYATGMVDFLNQ